MRCSSKKYTILIFLVSVFLFGCSNTDPAVPYGMLSNDTNYTFGVQGNEQTVKMFAEDLCAADSNITDTSSINYSGIYSAAVYDINSLNVLYSYNATTRVNPASITKIMTALIILENMNLDENITVPDVTISEGGVQLFKLNEGDIIGARDLFNVMLIYSGNDCALAFAKSICGTEAEFVDLMNARAEELGCTNTHFSNCMGLTDSDHYTTAYDLYLIFNECIKHQEFIDAINTEEYTCTYTSGGEFTTRTVITTNKYLTGEYSSPNNVAIIGGKTGTTTAAGKCILLYAKDNSGNPYITVVMGAADEPDLYSTMNQLCNDIIN